VGRAGGGSGPGKGHNGVHFGRDRLTALCFAQKPIQTVMPLSSRR